MRHGLSSHFGFVWLLSSKKPESCQKVARKLPESRQTFAKRLPESCQEFARKLPASCQKVYRWSWYSHDTVMRQSWDSHEVVRRQSRDSRETVYYSTPVAGFANMFVPVCSMKLLVTFQQDGHKTMSCLLGQCHGKHRKSCEKLPWELVGCPGVKVFFLLKDVIITTSVTTVVFITITIWVFELSQLFFFIFAQFEFLSFITVWVLDFCHNLGFFFI